MKRKQSPAQEASRKRAWALYTIAGAIGTLQRLQLADDYAKRRNCIITALEALQHDLRMDGIPH